MKTPDEAYLNICRQKIAIFAKEKTELDKKSHELNQEIRAIRFFAIKEKWGVEAGSLVKGPNGKIYRVSLVDLKFGNLESDLKEVPWIKGNLQKADGTFSVMERRLFENWVLVE